MRLGKLEDVERSDGEHISLRVFVGSRSASIGSSDLGEAALDELASRAVAMARAAPEDRYAGLAPEDMLFRGATPSLDLEDAEKPSPKTLRATAEAAEDAARAVTGVTNSEGAGASAGRGLFALATSHGFAGAYGSTSHSLSASVVAGEGSGMQRDYAWRTARHGEDVAASRRNRPACRREAAVARLNPGKLKSGPLPVVFDPRVGGTLDRPSGRRHVGLGDCPARELPARPARTSLVRSRRGHRRRSATARVACARARSTAKAWRPAGATWSKAGT